jgi:hypothetical protein
VPHPVPQWCGAALPGVAVADSDGPGFLVCAGPRDTLVVHPEDTGGLLELNPASFTEIGCCGRTRPTSCPTPCGWCLTPREVTTAF